MTAAIADRFFDSRRYRETTSALWQRHFGCPKEVAAALGQTARAARNQFDGDNGPAGHVLINAMIVSEAVVADVLREIGHGDIAALVEDKAARREAHQALERLTESVGRASAILRPDDAA